MPVSFMPGFAECLSGRLALALEKPAGAAGEWVCYQYSAFPCCLAWQQSRCGAVLWRDRWCVGPAQMSTTGPPDVLQRSGSGAGVFTASAACGVTTCCLAGCTWGTVCWQQRASVRKLMRVF